MCTIECRYCDRESSYELHPNFMVFCPGCKRRIHFECEYGYGPVAPCMFFLGDILLGDVTINEDDIYTLNIKGDRSVELKERYLDALYEAENILKNILNPGGKYEEQTSLTIKNRRGNLCFYGDWPGRPWDNWYEIKQYSYREDVLEIVFGNWERLIVFHPIDIINTANEFCINEAKKVKWIWNSPDGIENKTSYELGNEKVHKSVSGETMSLNRKSPWFAVYFG